MQTKKKIDSRNYVREQTSPKHFRHQKRMTVVNEMKVNELITSSARKQKSEAALLKKNKDAEAAKVLNAKHNVSSEKEGDEVDDQCLLDTIFSPAFHATKDLCESREIMVNNGEINHESARVGDLNTDAYDNYDSDVYYIYEDLSLDSLCKNSKLGFIDEPCHDAISSEATEASESDDFDPYLFIKSLPDLSAVVPTFRPMLLPKQTRSCPSTTLVLDLDETLVHSSLEPCVDADFTFPVYFNNKEHTVYVRCRPYLKDFMERVASLFEIIIFTASQSIYAEQLLNVLDPKRRLFRHRVFRESCVFVEGNYLKDLSVLGRDLAHIAIIDNSLQAFGFQVDNGIPIESWFDDRSDQELLLLLPFLESLVGADDVRPIIAKKFNVRDKISAAAYPSLLFSK